MSPVSAAPNRSEIVATVLDIGSKADHPDKWLMRLRIDQIRPLQGGSFVTPGQEVDAFTFGAVSGAEPGHRITAEAEYIGGPFRGSLRLYKLVQAD